MATDLNLMDLEDKILRYFQNKEIAKERREENELLLEEIEQHFKQSSEDGQLVFQLPNGEWAVLQDKAYVKEEFDQEGLAQQIQVAKDELKKPLDYCIFTAKGKLTPDLVQQHTHTRSEIKMKLTKRKTKPRKK